MAGEDFDIIGQSQQLLHAGVLDVGTGAGQADQIDTADVTDKQRITRADKPWIGSTWGVADHIGHVLGRVPWGMQCADDDIADVDLGAVIDGLVGIADVGDAWRVDGRAGECLDRPAGRKIVGVHVCLEDSRNAQAFFGGEGDVLFCRKAGVDDGSLAFGDTADEVRRGGDGFEIEWTKYHDNTFHNKRTNAHGRISAGAERPA